MDNIFEKTKQITSVLRNATIDFEKPFPYNPFIEQIAAIMGCNICLLNTKGTFLGYYYSDVNLSEEKRLKNFFTYQRFSEPILKEALMIYEVEPNQTFEQSILHPSLIMQKNFASTFVSASPIYANDLRLGTIFALSGATLTFEQLALLEVFSTIVGIQLASSMLERLEAERRDATITSLLQSLSRSELETFRTIIEKIEL